MGSDAPLPPIDFRVIVELNDVKNESDVDRYAMADTIQGVVINEIRKIDSETKKLLSTGYPNVDTENCWLLVAGKQPPSPSGATMKTGIGIVATIGGIGIGVAGSRGPRDDNDGLQVFDQPGEDEPAGAIAGQDQNELRRSA